MLLRLDAEGYLAARATLPACSVRLDGVSSNERSQPLHLVHERGDRFRCGLVIFTRELYLITVANPDRKIERFPVLELLGLEAHVADLPLRIQARADFQRALGLGCDVHGHLEREVFRTDPQKPHQAVIPPSSARVVVALHH